jgi:hypothetical protein
MCGDDLGAAWPYRRVLCYEDIVRKCSGKFSKGKHLRSHNWAIFTEDICQIRREKYVDLPKETFLGQSEFPPLPGGKKGELLNATTVSTFGRWANCVPLKALANGTPDHHGRDLTVPIEMQVGALSESLAYLNKPRLIGKILRIFHGGIEKRLRKLGFQPCVPRSLGGAGLPPITDK